MSTLNELIILGAQNEHDLEHDLEHKMPFQNQKFMMTMKI